jgi:ketosteroid isomerase-like protein
MGDNDAILAANAAYYRAFTAGDFAAMTRIWGEEGVSCVHPGWPVLVGRDDILESYRSILASRTRARITHQDETVILSGDEARVLCVEIVEGAALAATNIYRRVGGAWLMVHHQASPIAMIPETNEPAPPSKRLN